ncbi:hypothetical protein [Deinococcus sp.]|uniref:hypothetical protein n=1 Tax=Deinococcus sp. TaxID=47478 RepID=UPI0025B9B643|nr:hypothetical protein [Deinococcus sp.]
MTLTISRLGNSEKRPQNVTVTIRSIVNSELARAQQAELHQVAATIPTDTAQQGVQQTRRRAG